MAASETQPSGAKLNEIAGEINNHCETAAGVVREHLERMQSAKDQIVDRGAELSQKINDLTELMEQTPDALTEHLNAQSQNILNTVGDSLEELAKTFENRLQETFADRLQELFRTETEDLLGGVSGVNELFQSLAVNLQDAITEQAGLAAARIESEVRQSCKESSRAIADAVANELMSEIGETVSLASIQTAVSQALSPYATQIRAAKELAEVIADSRGG